MSKSNNRNEEHITTLILFLLTIYIAFVSPISIIKYFTEPVRETIVQPNPLSDKQYKPVMSTGPALFPILT